MKIIGLSLFIKNDNTKYTVCLLKDNEKYIINNEENKLIKVDQFPIMHYRVDSYSNIEDVFDFSKNFINMNYFKLKERFSEIKRKVWIFKGDSLLGKTFLSDNMNLSKYETDISSELPETIKEEVIVLGNKYNFDIEDIKDRIYDKENVEIIVVEFKST